MQVIGAASKRAEGEAAEAASSAYRDELVCTLLATVDHHPWGTARCQPLFALDYCLCSLQLTSAQRMHEFRF